jgi:hypothetical protein
MSSRSAWRDRYVGLSFAPGPNRVEVGETDPEFVRPQVGFTAVLHPPVPSSPPRAPEETPDEDDGWREWDGDQA